MSHHFHSNSFAGPDLLPPTKVNEPHAPVILLCDCSASMSGRPIAQLSRAISKFRDDLCRSSKARDVIDVCVIAFNEEVKILQNWTPIYNLPDIEFKASGCTSLGKALNFAVLELKEQGRRIHQRGTLPRMPQIVLITDAYATDDVSAVAELVHQRTREKKLQLWVLGLQGYNKEVVFQLTGGYRALELLDQDSYDFNDFFNMMSSVLKAVSESAPGARIQIRNPLEIPGVNLKQPSWDDFLNG